MESCFPPLAGLSLRGSSSSKKHRQSTGAIFRDADNSRQPQSSVQQQQQLQQRHNNKDFMPKLEVLQDLDLYYIRQIASSLKVIIIFKLFAFLNELNNFKF